MIDTEDLSSYIPGYDEYCQPKEEVEEYDYSDDYYELMIIEKEERNSMRKIIDLSASDITLDEVMQLEDYVWKQDKLIPAEMIEGE